MKTMQLKLNTLVMVSLTSLSFISCSSDDDQIDETNYCAVRDTAISQNINSRTHADNVSNRIRQLGICT